MVIAVVAIVDAAMLVVTIATVVAVVTIAILLFVFLRSRSHGSGGWSNEGGGQQEVACYKLKSAMHVSVPPVEILIPVHSNRGKYETVAKQWMFGSAHPQISRAGDLRGLRMCRFGRVTV